MSVSNVNNGNTNSKGYGLQLKEVPTEVHNEVYSKDYKMSGGEVYSAIYGLYSSGKKEEATKYMNTFVGLQANPNSSYYNPYASGATNSAVLKNLSALTGNDYSKGISGDEITRLWDTYGNQYVATNTGGISSSKKNSTGAQIAYYLNQLAADEKTTVAAESELKNLQSEVSYWVSRGYSDEQIQSKIDWTKYNTLTKASEKSKTAGELPTQFNRAINWYGAEDTVNGMIYAARHAKEDGTVDFGRSSVFMYYGAGSGYTPDKYSEAARDHTSTAYHPYAFGASDDTKINQICKGLGITSFDSSILEDPKSRAWLVENDLYKYAEDAINNYIKASAEYKKYDTAIKEYIDEGHTWEEVQTRAEKLLENKDMYPTLGKMEESRKGGKALPLSDTVDFALPYAMVEFSKYYNDSVKGREEANKTDVYDSVGENQVDAIVSMMFLDKGLIDDNGNPVEGANVSWSDVNEYIRDNELGKAEGESDEDYARRIYAKSTEISDRLMAEKREEEKANSEQVQVDENFTAEDYIAKIASMDSKEQTDRLGYFADGIADILRGGYTTDKAAKSFFYKYSDLFGGNMVMDIDDPTAPGGTTTWANNTVTDEYGDVAGKDIQEANKAYSEGLITSEEYSDYLLKVAGLIDKNEHQRYDTQGAQMRGDLASVDKDGTVFGSLTDTIESRRAEKAEKQHKRAMTVAESSASLITHDDEYESWDDQQKFQYDKVMSVDISNVDDKGYDAAKEIAKNIHFELAERDNPYGIMTDEAAVYGELNTEYADTVAIGLETELAKIMKVARASGISFDDAMQAFGYSDVNSMMDKLSKDYQEKVTSCMNAVAESFSGINEQIGVMGNADFTAVYNNSTDAYKSGIDEAISDYREYGTEADKMNLQAKYLSALNSQGADNLDAVKSGASAPMFQGNGDGAGAWNLVKNTVGAGWEQHLEGWGEVALAFMINTDDELETLYRTKYAGIEGRQQLRDDLYASIAKINDPTLKAEYQMQLLSYKGDITQFKFDMGTVGVRNWIREREANIQEYDTLMSEICTPLEMEIYKAGKSTVNSVAMSVETVAMTAALTAAGMGGTAATLLASYLTTGLTEAAPTFNSTIERGGSRGEALGRFALHSTVTAAIEAALDDVLNRGLKSLGIKNFGVDSVFNFHSEAAGAIASKGLLKMTGTGTVRNFVADMVNLGTKGLVRGVQNTLNSAVFEPIQETLETFVGQVAENLGVNTGERWYDLKELGQTWIETLKSAPMMGTIGGGITERIGSTLNRFGTNVSQNGLFAGIAQTAIDGVNGNPLVQAVNNYRMSEAVVNEAYAAVEKMLSAQNDISAITADELAEINAQIEMAGSYENWLDEMFSIIAADQIAVADMQPMALEVMAGEQGTAYKTAQAEAKAAQMAVDNAQKTADSVNAQYEQAMSELEATDTPDAKQSKQFAELGNSKQIADKALAAAKKTYENATAKAQSAKARLMDSLKSVREMAKAGAIEKVNAIKEANIQRIKDEDTANREKLYQKYKTDFDGMIADLRSKAGDFFADRAQRISEVMGEELMENYADREAQAEMTFSQFVRDAFHGWSVQYDEIKNGAGAFVDKTNHTITFNLKATAQEKFGSLISHELTHIAKISSQYATVREAVISALYGNDTSDSYKQAIEDAKQRYEDGTDLDEEVVAEGMGKIFTSGTQGNWTLFAGYVTKNGGIDFGVDLYDFLRKQAGRIKKYNAENGFFKQKFNAVQEQYAGVVNAFADAIKDAVEINNKLYDEKHGTFNGNPFEVNNPVNDNAVSDTQSENTAPVQDEQTNTADESVAETQPVNANAITLANDEKAATINKKLTDYGADTSSVTFESEDNVTTYYDANGKVIGKVKVSDTGKVSYLTRGSDFKGIQSEDIRALNRAQKRADKQNAKAENPLRVTTEELFGTDNVDEETAPVAEQPVTDEGIGEWYKVPAVDGKALMVTDNDLYLLDEETGETAIKPEVAKRIADETVQALKSGASVELDPDLYPAVTSYGENGQTVIDNSNGANGDVVTEVIKAVNEAGLYDEYNAARLMTSVQEDGLGSAIEQEISRNETPSEKANTANIPTVNDLVGKVKKDVNGFDINPNDVNGQGDLLSDWLRAASPNAYNIMMDSIMDDSSRNKDAHQYVVFDPTQIKSADLDTGVPLSQRFDSTNPDIRNSYLWKRGASSMQSLVEAWDYALQDAIANGNNNLATKMLSKITGIVNSNDRLRDATNTPANALRALVANAGSHLYEGAGFKAEAPTAQIDAHSKALFTDSVTAHNFAGNMVNAGQVVLDRLKVNGDTITGGKADFNDFFFNYMTHDDIQLKNSSELYSNIADIFKAELDKDASLKLYVDRARSQITGYFGMQAIDRTIASLKTLSKARSERRTTTGLRQEITRVLDKTESARLVDEMVAELRGKYTGDMQRQVLYTAYSATGADNWWHQTRVDINGNRLIGDTVSDIAEKHGIKQQDYEMVNAYLMAREALDRYDASRTPRADGSGMLGEAPFESDFDVTGINNSRVSMDEDTCKATVAEIERNYPEIAAFCKDFYRLWDNFMQAIVVDNGLLSQEDYDAMKHMHPHYAPLKRYDGSYRLTRAEGHSDATVINPMEEMYQMMQSFTQQAANHRIMEEFNKIYEQTPGMGALATRYTQADIDNGTISAIPMDAIGYTDADGNTVWYQVADEGLRSILRGTYGNTKSTGRILGFVGKLTRGMSMLTTGVNFIFAGKNAVRDFQHSVNYGSWATSYFDGLFKWLSAFKDVASEVGFEEFGIQGGKGSETVKDYIAMGGGGWQAVDLSNGTSNKDWKNDTFGYKSKTSGIMHNIGKIITCNSLNEIIETTSRYAEYRFGQNATNADNANGQAITDDTKKRAFMASMEATVDFRRGGNGNSIAVLRKVIPFFNATLQGQYQDYRMLFDEAERDRLPQRVGKMVLNNCLTGALSALMFMAFGGDDDEEKQAYLDLSDDIKRGYILIPGSMLNGSRDCFRIPLTQGGLSQVLYEAGRKAVEEAFTGESSDMVHDGFFNDLVQVAWNTTFGNLLGMTSIASPFLDVSRNKNYYGGDIISSSMQGRYYTQQYDEGTAGLFVDAAQTFDTLLDWLGVDKNDSDIRQALASPVALEYILKQFTGIIGQVVPAMISPNRYTGEVTPMRSLAKVFTNAWTLDMDSNSDLDDAFYEDMDMLDQIQKGEGYTYGWLNPKLGEDDTPIALAEAKRLTTKGGELYDVKERLSVLAAQKRAILSNKNLSQTEREEQAEGITRQMADVYREGLGYTGSYKDDFCGGSAFKRLTQSLSGYKIKAMSNTEYKGYLMNDSFKQDYENGAEYMQMAYKMQDRYPTSNILPKADYALTVADEDGEDYGFNVPDEYRDEFDRIFYDTYKELAQMGVSVNDTLTPKKEKSTWSGYRSKAQKAAKSWLLSVYNPLDN